MHGWPLRSGRRWPAEVTSARWTPPPRGKGSTHPGRISFVWNVETPLGSGRSWPGRPTARKAQLPSGNRMAQEANAGSRKETGTRGSMAGLSTGRPAQPSGYGCTARTRKAADVGQVSLCGLTGQGRRNRGTSWTPRRTGRSGLGRSGLRRDGERTRGRRPGLGVGRLAPGRGGRTASAAEDLHGIAGRGPQEGPQLAELMLRSRSNTLLSVRRVTEINAGRATAGEPPRV